MRRIAIGLIGVLAVSSAACGAATPAATSSSGGTQRAEVGALAGKTGAQVLSAAVAAAEASGAAHYVLQTKEGSQTQTVTGDYGNKQARQTISEGSQQIKVLFVGGVAFVQGNSAGLQTAMGLSAAKAATYAGKWIAVAKTDSPFSAIEKASTLQSTLTQLEPTGRLTFTKVTTLAGRQAIGVKGGLPKGTESGISGSQTLYVATTSPVLPLRFEGQATEEGETVRSTAVFSRWGQPQHLSAPTDTIAYSTVSAK